MLGISCITCVSILSFCTSPLFVEFQCYLLMPVILISVSVIVP